MNLQNIKRFTDLENELMVAGGEGWREGIVGEFGMKGRGLLGPSDTGRNGAGTILKCHSC